MAKCLVAGSTLPMMLVLVQGLRGEDDLEHESPVARQKKVVEGFEGGGFPKALLHELEGAVLHKSRQFNASFAGQHEWNQRDLVHPLVQKVMKLYFNDKAKPAPPPPAKRQRNDKAPTRPTHPQGAKGTSAQNGRRKGKWHDLPVVLGEARLEALHARGLLRHVSMTPKVWRQARSW